MKLAFLIMTAGYVLTQGTKANLSPTSARTVSDVFEELRSLVGQGNSQIVQRMEDAFNTMFPPTQSQNTYMVDVPEDEVSFEDLDSFFSNQKPVQIKSTEEIFKDLFPNYVENVQ